MFATSSPCLEADPFTDLTAATLLREDDQTCGRAGDATTIITIPTGKLLSRHGWPWFSNCGGTLANEDGQRCNKREGMGGGVLMLPNFLCLTGESDRQQSLVGEMGGQMESSLDAIHLTSSRARGGFGVRFSARSRVVVAEC